MHPEDKLILRFCLSLLNYAQLCPPLWHGYIHLKQSIIHSNPANRHVGIALVIVLKKIGKIFYLQVSFV